MPRSPADEPDAYVDQHDPPFEMQVAAYMKGGTCTVPGCRNPAEVLDHRIAYNNGGPTSVTNLWPMCVPCNASKGDKDYLSWLAERVFHVPR
jgi:5-methylcytosine-specific restriction endonuclease McrA